jgi:hypothetical protein
VIASRPLPPRPARRAVTLLELLLVLCLLVILAAFSWPALERPMASQRLRAAASAVRAEWSRARVKAMSSGQTVQFRYAPNGNQYSIELTADAALSPDLLSAGELDDYPGDVQNELAAAEGPQLKLPEGVTFVCGETAGEALAGAAALETELWASEGTALGDTALGDIAWEDTGWSEPILFYPDGTSSDARLVLKNEHNCRVELSLRGLTGVVTLGDVYAADDLGEELLP